MEKVLTFKYPCENIAEVNKLKELFASNNVEFICHESDGWYSHEFTVKPNPYLS